MKGLKGKMMKKLKTVKQIGYLKPDRILQVSALDGLAENFSLKKPSFVDNLPFKSKPKPNPDPNHNLDEPEIIDVQELMKDLDEEDVEDKENIIPCNVSDPVGKLSETVRSIETVSSETSSSWSTDSKPDCTDEDQMPLSELDMSCFRRPDMDSGTLFDPNLLAAFERAVSEHIRTWEEASAQSKPDNPVIRPGNRPDPLSELEDETDPLQEFDEKCPPGGSDSVIFYTTSLRGIRKTFEDCQSIRFLLQSFRVVYYERDVSIHSEFRDELWGTMGEKMVPPRLFIRGRYIGGAEQVLRLHEQERFRPLFRDIPIDYSDGPCNGCSGLRFGLCLNCDGSRKVFEHDGGIWSECTQCNENGLIVCPFCS